VNTLRKPNRTRSEIVAFGAYSAFTSFLAFIFYSRWKWAMPDAPYLSQLTSIDIVKSALNGDYGPLVNAFSRFDGEHKLWIYYVYLYLDARFMDFSTITEIAIWTISSSAIVLAIGWYCIRVFSIGFWDLRFLFLLVIPATGMSTAFFPGRGMETQIQISTSIAVLIILLVHTKLPLKYFSPIAFTVAGIYTILFSGSYFLGLFFALTITSLCAPLLSLGTPVARTRLYLMTGSVALWGGAYVFMMKVYASSSASNPAKSLELLVSDPGFSLRYFLNAFAATVMTLNTGEKFRENFELLAPFCGALVLILTSILLTHCILSARSKRYLLIPLLLVTYPIGIVLAVFLGRNSDPFQLLNIWYSFHFRLWIDGLVILAVVSTTFRVFSRQKILRLITIAVAASLLFVFGTAAQYQWTRNVHERAYFGMIRDYELGGNPEKLGSWPGLTPIYLDPASSRHAIEFLQEYELVPFDR
jgi:hypothetical protein